VPHMTCEGPASRRSARTSPNSVYRLPRGTGPPCLVIPAILRQPAVGAIEGQAATPFSVASRRRGDVTLGSVVAGTAASPRSGRVRSPGRPGHCRSRRPPLASARQAPSSWAGSARPRRVQRVTRGPGSGRDVRRATIPNGPWRRYFGRRAEIRRLPVRSAPSGYRPNPFRGRIPRGRAHGSLRSFGPPPVAVRAGGGLSGRPPAARSRK
jgi:hypothetical protein